MAEPVVHGDFNLTELDIYLFKAGRHYKLYDKMGAHLKNYNNQDGVYFSVWAPNADSVSVLGDFNYWTPGSHSLSSRWDSSGIWEGFIPGVKKGDFYKFHIKKGSYEAQKIDPFAFYSEIPPKTASIVWDLSYEWNDNAWMEKQNKRNAFDSPISIYELHLGSWRRKDNNFLTFRELAHQITDYVKDMGFTHVELMPVMEHPFYGSWGYQILGFFSPTSRYGNPQDFMYFVDYLHQHDIGVILDWAPAHFPNDEHGLAFFDGSYLYEHEDPRQGFHPDWKSLIFNYGRKEVMNFLISSVLYYLDKYHIDGIRIDAVSSMLYLNYSRKENEWVPNVYGGHENLEAVEFLKCLNSMVHEKFPNVLMIAEESTNWPMVTKPVETGGLGFNYKWNMGWMHDTLRYIERDPIYRKYHHDEILFSMIYAYNENYLLVFSHDEVTHGKGSLYQKIPKDDWQRYATIRLLMGYKYTHPGKKLTFMGNELGQRYEWSHDVGMNWDYSEDSYENKTKLFIKDLNYLYREQSSLYKYDFHPEGFEWIDTSDYTKSIYSYLRKDVSSGNYLIIICNFTPECYTDYRIGVPFLGKWKEIMNSDNIKYNGSGKINDKEFIAEEVPYHNRPHSISVMISPLAISIIKKES